MLHQTLPILGQLWQLFEVSQILEFLRYVLLFNELDINDTSTVSLIVHLSVYRVLRKFEDIKVSVITSAVTPIQS